MSQDPQWQRLQRGVFLWSLPLMGLSASLWVMGYSYGDHLLSALISYVALSLVAGIGALQCLQTQSETGLSVDPFPILRRFGIFIALLIWLGLGLPTLWALLWMGVCTLGTGRLVRIYLLRAGYDSDYLQLQARCLYWLMASLVSGWAWAYSSAQIIAG